MYDPKAHNPNLDEIWSTLTHDIGVVSDIRGSTVVFLSLTGFRASVLWRSALGWKRTNDPTPIGSKCPCRGCERRAFLAYERDQGTELVCAYHAPSGTQLRITALSHETQTRPWSKCESCQVDGFEILGELQEYQKAQHQSKLWTCRYCGKHWITSEVPHPQTLTHLTAVLSIPCGYRLDGDFTEEHADLMTLTRTYRLPLKRAEQYRPMKGSRPKTFIDHLIDNDL